MKELFIGVIPARKGSKGLINKNILKINGKTLLEISVECALECNTLDKVIVSTDYDITQTGLEKFYKNEKFLFLSRSTSSSHDGAPTEDVIKEIVKQLDFPNNGVQKHIVLLQPTSPLRKSRHIYESINLYLNHGMNKLASFTMVGDHHPNRMYRINGINAISYVTCDSISDRRQNLENLYLRNGAIYICNLNEIMRGDKFASKTLVPFLMDQVYSINIDTEFDYKLANYIMSNESSTTRVS